MNNNSITSNGTPLRNSRLANRPFRSPFSNECSPSSSNVNLKKDPSSPCLTNRATPKRQIAAQQNTVKRRRIDVENYENSNPGELTKTDLLLLKQRIRRKRQEIESLKIKLASRKKHNQKDLQAQIQKWRLACQNALIQYHKDCQANFTGGTLEMSDILAMLGIPESIVKFPKDYENSC